MTLTFVHRTGCSLCDAAYDELESFLGGINNRGCAKVEVERIDLADEPRLELAYGHRIPVIECDGEEICHFFFDESALLECLSRQAIAV